ncbi:excisionase family DNA-binding protein [Knoellia sp. S7-12]|uniref:excisionase family DNA-binding protein n=1 Tax=Knoellia sp. S7-12 TaxID=3126698 RepID=UPI003368F679
MRKLNDDPVFEYWQAATYMNVKEGYLRDLTKQRRIETVKIGGLVRIRLSECERILHEGTRPATRPLARGRFN